MLAAAGTVEGELCAIYEGVKIITGQKKSITIRSDSKEALRAINTGKTFQIGRAHV